jgi:hypothetical protein
MIRREAGEKLTYTLALMHAMHQTRFKRLEMHIHTYYVQYCSWSLFVRSRMHSIHITLAIAKGW